MCNFAKKKMMRIKEILKEQNSSVNELAEKLDVSRQALSRQMKGKLLVETAERIADALNVPLWQLFSSPDEVFKELPSHVVTKNPFTCPYCGKELHIKIE